MATGSRTVVPARMRQESFARAEDEGAAGRQAENEAGKRTDQGQRAAGEKVALWVTVRGSWWQHEVPGGDAMGGGLTGGFRGRCRGHAFTVHCVPPLTAERESGIYCEGYCRREGRKRQPRATRSCRLQCREGVREGVLKFWQEDELRREDDDDAVGRAFIRALSHVTCGHGGSPSVRGRL